MSKLSQYFISLVSFQEQVLLMCVVLSKNPVSSLSHQQVATGFQEDFRHVVYSILYCLSAVPADLRDHFTDVTALSR